MDLTQDQSTALTRFEQFLRDEERYAFLLEGGAGVGKTFLLGQMLQHAQAPVIAATPTHKATNVLRRKLDGFGVPWCRGYDAFSWNGRDVITGTTAQLLGLRPIVADDQKVHERKFGAAGGGILSKLNSRLVVIDEVSMLDWPGFQKMVNYAKGRGAKVLAVGDAAQLPPVKAEAIPFDKFRLRATLSQVVRQAEGSAIIQVGWAVREGQPWRAIQGAGLQRVANLRSTFLERVSSPAGRAEEDREVFIAYRNARVDELQDAACRKVYGHGAKAFAPGELVLAEGSFYEGKKLLCANQDELIVEGFDEAAKDATTGVPVRMRHARGKRSFYASYLPPEDLENPAHPYNVELKKRSNLANELQEKYKRADRRAPGTSDLDQRRRKAWADFFDWKDSTILTFRHPFALTSHKSQGSTYREVFADVADLSKYATAALYVAVTRPRETLVVSE